MLDLASTVAWEQILCAFWELPVVRCAQTQQSSEHHDRLTT